MANESRKYAEGLVGDLDRTFYGTQREVGKKIYDTNWKKLQRQYQNLTEDLKLKQQQIDRSFAEGLATVAENDYLRSRAAANDLAMRGLVSSGKQNIADQNNINTKGGEVLNLMDSAGGGTVEIAKAMENARQTLADKELSLNDKLAETLSNIGAAEGEALQAYNAGLADIAGAKDVRDMENELAKLQFEAQRQAQGYSRTGVEDAEEAQAQRNLMMDVLKSTDWTDADKSAAIQIFFGKDADSANAIVTGYNMYVDPTNAIKTRIKDITAEIAAIDKSISKEEKFDAAEQTVGNSVPFFGLGAGGKAENQRVEENIEAYYDVLDPKIGELRDELEKLKEYGYEYEDLAALMYGTGIDIDTVLGKESSSGYKYKGDKTKTETKTTSTKTTSKEKEDGKTDWSKLFTISKVSM